MSDEIITDPEEIRSHSGVTWYIREAIETILYRDDAEVTFQDWLLAAGVMLALNTTAFAVAAGSFWASGSPDQAVNMLEVTSMDGKDVALAAVLNIQAATNAGAIAATYKVFGGDR